MPVSPTAGMSTAATCGALLAIEAQVNALEQPGSDSSNRARNASGGNSRSALYAPAWGAWLVSSCSGPMPASSASRFSCNAAV